MGSQTLEFEFNSAIVYAAGTVNGLEVVLEQDEANPSKWSCSVPVSESELYVIAFEIYDEAGNVTYYNDTIEFLIPEFIFDRTQKDIEKFLDYKNRGYYNLTDKEKQEWDSGLKGCLNYKDLKRIESCMKIISDMLELNLNTRKDSLPEFPTSSYFEHLLGNLRTIRDTEYVFTTTPEIPEQPLNTYAKFNAIEKILYDVYTLYNNQFKYYCGEDYYCGDSVGMLL